MLNNASIPVKLMPGKLTKAYKIRHEPLFASVIFEGGGHFYTILFSTENRSGISRLKA